MGPSSSFCMGPSSSLRQQAPIVFIYAERAQRRLESITHPSPAQDLARMLARRPRHLQGSEFVDRRHSSRPSSACMRPVQTGQPELLFVRKALLFDIVHMCVPKQYLRRVQYVEKDSERHRNYGNQFSPQRIQ